MRIERREIEIPATDGYRLTGTELAPAGGAPPSAPVVLLTAAIGVHRGVYEAYARYLAERGATAVTFDYRGVGGSLHGPLRQLDTDLRAWGERDVAGAIAWAAERFPGAPLLYAGHSAGGQLLGLAANAPALRRVLMVAAPSGYWRLWRGPRRLWIAALWFVVFPAAARTMGYLPGRRLGLGADLPRGVALQWARWGRNPHYISDAGGRPLREGHHRVLAPIRAYSFADDPFAPKQAVDELLGYYANAPREHCHLHPADRGLASIGHLGFYRERMRQTLWAETADWLFEGSAPAPGGNPSGS